MLQTSITPPVLSLPDPHHGVYFPLLSAVETTIVCVFGYGDLELSSPPKTEDDGPGRHAIYRQKDDVQTNNIILTVFCPIQLTNSNDGKVWEEQVTQFTTDTKTAQKRKM